MIVVVVVRERWGRKGDERRRVKDRGRKRKQTVRRDINQVKSNQISRVDQPRRRKIRV